MGTEETSIGEEGVGGDDDAFSAAEGDHCTTCHDRTGQVADGVVLGLSTHLNIF
jgi:hypothetical protein